MTTAKGFVRLFGVLVLVAVVIFAISSCGDDEASDDALSVLLEITDETEIYAEAEHYVVILPATSGGALVDKAYELASEIEDKTGTDTVVQYDNDKSLKLKNSIEIILGNTDKTQSKAALGGLRSRDYVCKRISGDIVIGGLNDTATLTALDKFMSEILPYSSAEQLMSSGSEFSFVGEYALSDVKLSGYPVGDFKITYNSKQNELGDLASSIADFMRDDIGYELTVFGTTARKDGVKEIFLEISDSGETEEAYVINGTEDVILRSRDVYGLTVAAESFCLAIKSNDTVRSSDWSTWTVKCPNPEIAVKYIELDEQSPSADKISLINDCFYEADGQMLVVLGLDDKDVSFMDSHLTDGCLYAQITAASQRRVVLIHNEEMTASGEYAKNGSVNISFSLEDVKYETVLTRSASDGNGFYFDVTFDKSIVESKPIEELDFGDVVAKGYRFTVKRLTPHKTVLK